MGYMQVYVLRYPLKGAILISYMQGYQNILVYVGFRASGIRDDMVVGHPTSGVLCYGGGKFCTTKGLQNAVSTGCKLGWHPAH